MEVYKRKTIINTISKSALPRFKPTEKTLAPSPSTYNTAKVEDYIRTAKAKYSFGKDKRISFIDAI